MTTLTNSDAKPLELLLKAPSKNLLDKIFVQVFKHMHGNAEQAKIIETSLESGMISKIEQLCIVFSNKQLKK